MNNVHPLVCRLFPFFLALFTLLAAEVQAAGAGSVISTSGSASIVSAEGKARKPEVGSTINAGDTAVTGDKGQLNIRFSDESIVQLHAQSQFRVDQYAFNGKSDESAKGFFSLLKGGMRTVTGLLGKINHAAYRVRTPTATIGIRGTEYSARISNGLHVKVDRGEISLANRAGTFSVTEGQRAYIADRKSAPKYLNLGSSAQNGSGGKGGNGAAAGTQLQGNTQINANAINTNAIAVGQGNAAGNRVGSVGGK